MESTYRCQMFPKKIMMMLLFSAFLFTGSAQAGIDFLSLFIAHKHENCPKSSSLNQNTFCSQFKAAATCHCTSSGMPEKLCLKPETVYKRMLMVFGTQQKACEYQQDTSTQSCMDSWNCYRLGGKDSEGRLCSGTGHSCLS